MIVAVVIRGMDVVASIPQAGYKRDIVGIHLTFGFCSPTTCGGTFAARRVAAPGSRAGGPGDFRRFQRSREEHRAGATRPRRDGGRCGGIVSRAEFRGPGCRASQASRRTVLPDADRPGVGLDLGHPWARQSPDPTDPGSARSPYVVALRTVGIPSIPGSGYPLHSRQASSVLKRTSNSRNVRG